MGVRKPNSTSYVHEDEPNLLNLHKAMDYSSAGQPVLRVNNVGSVSYNDAGNISGSIDAFGRMRVSNPFTLFDGSLRYHDDSFKWDQLDAGAGTSTFLTNESSVLMSVTGNGDSVTRQSKQVFSYQPGKSLLIFTTFVMNTPTIGLRQRVGYFGAQNGVYLEVNGTELSFVIRKYTDGIVDDTTERIPQSAWNGDRVNGQGGQYNISGINLDVSKAQIFWCDLEWLGVGSVRCGFVINGQLIVSHIFHHANLLNKVYMTTATLPVRYEISSTGPAGSMKAICSTVISEGGYANRSISRAIGTSLTGKNLSNLVYTPLVSIRLKSTNIDGIVVPVKFDLYGLQQNAFGYQVLLNPTLTNAAWTNVGSDSNVEYDISATALTNGTLIDTGIFVGNVKGGAISVSRTDVDFSQQLGRTINNVSDIWCLAAISTTVNDDCAASVSWEEYS